MVMGLLVMPMFLFSGIFVPVARFPEPVQWIMQATPLYHAVALLRQLTTGDIEPVDRRASGVPHDARGSSHSAWRCTGWSVR